MRKRDIIKIFSQVFKITRFNRILLVYLITFVVFSLLMLLSDPGITNIGDALWYSFVSTTTIGFGDLTATTVLARVLTVLLYIYSLVIIALFTAITTQVIREIVKAQRNESTAVLLYDLEHLDEMSPDRLKEISDIVKKTRGRIQSK